MEQISNYQNNRIITLDHKFLDIPRTIASYIVPHQEGIVLVESGPSSTRPNLEIGLAAHEFKTGDVTDVLLTHIHLDHAGAAGWLARQGARIHVHHVGAPHLLDPSKLLSSAARIYGDQMDQLWGEFLAVPKEKLVVLHDNDLIEIGDLRFRALDTPGHAYHHMAYIFEDMCFSGDIGGVRIDFETPHLRLPMPPPEFHLENWHQSLERLRSESFRRIAPTHFGIYSNTNWHLDALETSLNQVEKWMKAVMPEDPPPSHLREQYSNWAEQRSLSAGLKPEWLKPLEVINPSWMSADGIRRYWQKHRQG